MRLRGFVLIGAIISIVVGFTLGRAVIAGSFEPGSSEDPVVTQSYADKKILERVSMLEESVAKLVVQAETLQDTVNDLQTKIKNSSKPTTATTTTKPTNNNNGQNEPVNQPTKPPETTPPADSSMVGKSMVIKTENFVNLRSAPTTDANILKKVTKEETMVIQKAENGWYNVKLDDGTIGWVANYVVKLK